ncbi:MAG: lytic transglycosylase domain-containing protein [Deltaproteobacteria bacterium]|nr:MAG: lytic transglycosylase domain-containing protein [Deltaproteobacteria bacterium]
MSTEFLACKGHPPHGAFPERKGIRPSVLIFFSVLLLAISPLRFHLFHLPGVRHIAAGYQNIEETIDHYTPLRWAYSLVNPELQTRQEAIRQILSILQRHETGLAEVMREEVAEVIYEESTRHNHDPKFILALIAIESSFQNWSVSERGAKGLMQIMPYVAESIAQELGIEWSGDRTLFNPTLNIKMGIHYLTRLFGDFKDPELALAAYNYGPTYVKGLIERKRRVPQDFYEKIVATYREFVVSTSGEDSLPFEYVPPAEMPI